MIHRGGLAICSDAGRCSGVRGRQIPRIHRDLGARMNLPDSLGTGGRTHGRGLHHRWPHPRVCSFPRGLTHVKRGYPREGREQIRQSDQSSTRAPSGKQGRRASKSTLAAAAAGSIDLSFLSCCFPVSTAVKKRVSNGRRNEKLSLVLTVGPEEDPLRWHSPPSVLVDYHHGPFPPSNVHRLVLPTYPDLLVPTPAPAWNTRETVLDPPSTREVSPRNEGWRESGGGLQSSGTIPSHRLTNACFSTFFVNPEDGSHRRA